MRQTDERIAFCGSVPPPGEMLPINVQTFDIHDNVPSNLEIREAMRKLQSRQAAGAMGLQA
jgi:hypothetical protein